MLVGRKGGLEVPNGELASVRERNIVEREGSFADACARPQFGKIPCLAQPET